jgi:hypothetical protein
LSMRVAFTLYNCFFPIPLFSAIRFYD